MAEYIQRRAHLSTWLQRATPAFFVGAGAVVFAHGELSIATFILILFGGLAGKASPWIGDTVRCPPRGNKLDPRAFRGEGEPAVRSCPKRGADLSQPMPQVPVNPIS